MKTTTAKISAMCCLLAWVTCTTDMSGGSTESTNQRTANTVYEPDGITPAEGAIVVIRSQNTLAAIAGVTPEQPEVTSDTAVTDEYGKYAFDNALGDGLYSFEASKDGNAVFVNPVSIMGGDSALEIDPVTLKPTGKITGSIHLAEGGDPTEVYVLALGIDRFARVNDSGAFTFDSLGEGNYYLKIITTIDTYTGFDTAWITVYPGRTTDLGTIALPFSGIPVPQNVQVTYNPDLQQATIRWNRVKRPGIHYNIYRGYNYFPHKEFYFDRYERVNGHRVTDTVFIDSTIVGLGKNNLPEAVSYSITIVDSSENEGDTSRAVIVGTPQSIAVINDSILITAPLNGINDFAIARNGDIYVTCGNAPYMAILDSALNYKGKFQAAELLNTDSSANTSPAPTCICINKTTELLYIAPSGNTGLFIHDFTGALIDSIKDPAILAFGVTDCEVIDNTLYVIAGADSIVSFDSDGNRKAAWRVNKGQCLVDGGAGQVVVSSYKQICWYDRTGNLLSSKQTMDALYSIAMDTTKQHLFILTIVGISFGVKEYDHTGIKISQYAHPDAVIRSGGILNPNLRLQADGNPLVLFASRLLRLRALNN